MNKDYYIWLDGIQVPVTEEMYRTYKRAEWREEKQQAVRSQRESSFEFMSENDFDGQAVADQMLVDDIVADKILLEELYAALAELTEDEQRLINSLYYKERSERDLAKDMNVVCQHLFIQFLFGHSCLYFAYIYCNFILFVSIIICFAQSIFYW
ncbi:sigma-70 family RNA polymerase sigma factor [Anaerosporobacter sp.]|uniref:sigma-70 family RNA polymerase sigma factor n=1 Tax=Anaerosporobacter sp. TaxID=1872529 RepID=UPI00286F4CF6|nr:sigma-70 family RNA polymerase sigma factor [Anaerosporobacter sp.]